MEVVSAVTPECRAEAEVVSLGQVADKASGTYELRARIPNPQGRFRGGMVVIARTTTQTDRRALHVPVTALLHAYGQRPYVLLVDTNVGRAAAREVELGQIRGERAEIVRGLETGELLIVRGHDRVVAGDRVKFELAPPAPSPTEPAS